VQHVAARACSGQPHPTSSRHARHMVIAFGYQVLVAYKKVCLVMLTGCMRSFEFQIVSPTL